MRYTNQPFLKSFLFLALLITGPGLMAQSNSDIEEALQEKFVLAEDGDTILLPAGKYTLSSSLWIDGKKDILIKGAGIRETQLSFKGQTQGAEGIKVTSCQRVVMEDFTVLDAKGDGVKAQDCNGVVFRRIKAAWTGRKAKKTNGAYGLYPVQCENVLIEGCEVRGASDAGVYVGQSRGIVVRNNKAWQNVLGIEIENSTSADVYENKLWDNAGGCLMVVLPDLPVRKGGKVRFFGNELVDNNHKNFGAKGATVSLIPPGSGIMIMAINNVEVFDNKVEAHKTTPASIMSFYLTEKKWKDSLYDPFCHSISFYNNVFNNKPRIPALSNRIGKLIFLKFKRKRPDIMYDGLVDPDLANEDGMLPQDKRICIRNNGGATFANLDAQNDFKNISWDLNPYNCEGKSVPAVNLEERLAQPNEEE